ncbi:YunG family protein [Streptomyces californicus]
MSWRIGPASSPATVARPVTYTDIAAPMPEARLRQAKRATARRPADVSTGCDAAGMTPWNLLDIHTALRASWAADTCTPSDVTGIAWQPGNPAWGHCDITALIVNDIFGGDLVVGEVHCTGEPQGFHWWNRLPSGVELDLTREQFQDGQTVTAARAVERPPGPLPRRWEEYLLLRERVSQHLGRLPGPAV